MIIKPQVLSSELFNRYGKVVVLSNEKPTSEDKSYKFWSDIAHYHIDGRTEIGLCTVYKQVKKIITSLEKHDSTPEILVPSDAPFILPLQKNDEVPEAFIVNPGEAVVIDKGIWHGACIPIHEPESTYFVIFKHGTPHEDVQFKDIESVEIVG
jgi:ureidoglycolate lyase